MRPHKVSYKVSIKQSALQITQQNMSIINVHGYDKSNAKCSEDTVHRFVLAGGFRILPERRSRTGISVVGSGGKLLAMVQMISNSVFAFLFRLVRWRGCCQLTRAQQLLR